MCSIGMGQTKQDNHQISAKQPLDIGDSCMANHRTALGCSDTMTTQQTQHRKVWQRHILYAPCGTHTRKALTDSKVEHVETWVTQHAFGLTLCVPSGTEVCGLRNVNVGQLNCVHCPVATESQNWSTSGRQPVMLSAPKFEL